jgi:predicted PurR-regulated permease PerM
MDGGNRQHSPLGELWAPSAPDWLRSLGTSGWLTIGVVGCVAIIAWLFGRSASIMIPLVLAFVIGVIFYPLVERMARMHIPRWLGALIVLLLLTLIIIFVAWVVGYGVVSQWPRIQESVQEGISSAKSWLHSLGISQQIVTAVLERLQSSGGGASQGAMSGIAASASSMLSGVGAGLFGVFIGAVLLYYLLSDYPRIIDYLSSHLGLPVELGRGIVNDASASLRGHFQGTTISGAVVAAFIGVGVWALGVPLAGAIGAVTFLTCYIPFFGAFISGAFAFLIALGTNGLTSAMLVLVVALVGQNLVQTIVSSKAMGESLSLHPIVILVVTMLGGIFAGLLGAMLAAPGVATLLLAKQRMTEYARSEGELLAENARPTGRR